MGRRLTAALARPEIGIAGAILEYPNGTIQHAGVVLGMGDAAGHCGRFQRNSTLWPWLRMSRDVTAVTGAMLAMRLDLFREMGGFDEAFPVNYNDVDLCLRVRKAGLRVVCLNVGKVVHRESQTRIGGRATKSARSCTSVGRRCCRVPTSSILRTWQLPRESRSRPLRMRWKRCKSTGRPMRPAGWRTAGWPAEHDSAYASDRRAELRSLPDPAG